MTLPTNETSRIDLLHRASYTTARKPRDGSGTGTDMRGGRGRSTAARANRRLQIGLLRANIRAVKKRDRDALRRFGHTADAALVPVPPAQHGFRDDTPPPLPLLPPKARNGPSMKTIRG